MNIIVMGAGYVGLVTGACFAELGNQVVCIDVNINKVINLRKGILPIYEPGLEEMVLNNMKHGRLHFATAITDVADDPDVIFIAVGTPSDEAGAADIKYVLEVARTIGMYIKKSCLIVDKSTVPVGMADQVEQVIQHGLEERGCVCHFEVVSNPEFLREGAAIEDFMQPDRVIIGLESTYAKEVMLDLYLPIMRSPERIFFMNVKDAEMTKYAANAMLATRISFMNEIAALCERMGVDIESVRVGIGSDSRIGKSFLYPGCGYGGSCFPKDVRALIKMAENAGLNPLILNAVEERNLKQKHLLPEKITHIFGEDLSGLKIAVWGLAFKPGTDDMREASSVILLQELIKRGAIVQAYDPAAMGVARNVLPASWFSSKQLILKEDQYAALDQVDALVLVTEWNSFCQPDFLSMKCLMRRPIILDGRNQYDPKHISAAGFHYVGIARGLCPEQMVELHETAVA